MVFSWFKKVKKTKGLDISHAKDLVSKPPNDFANTNLGSPDKLNDASKKAYKLWLKGKYSEALSLYDLILDSLPSVDARRFTIRERRAMVLCRLCRYKEAECEFEEIISTVERNIGPLSRLENIFYWLQVAKYRGDEDKALKEFKKAR